MQQQQQEQQAHRSRSIGGGQRVGSRGDKHSKQHMHFFISAYLKSPGQHSALGQQTISSSVPKPHEGISCPVSKPILMYLSTCGSHCDDSRQMPGKFCFTIHESPSAMIARVMIDHLEHKSTQHTFKCLQLWQLKYVNEQQSTD